MKQLYAALIAAGFMLAAAPHSQAQPYHHHWHHWHHYHHRFDHHRPY